MKAAINIKPGGSMTDPSGTLVTWSPSNSVRVSLECAEVTEQLVMSVAQEVARHAGLLRDLGDRDMAELMDYYVINVSISQPRPDNSNDTQVSAALDTSSVEEFDDEEEDDEGNAEG